MSTNERQERGLSGIDIIQKMLDASIEQEDSVTKILVTRSTRDIAIDVFEEEFGYKPKRNLQTGKWE